MSTDSTSIKRRCQTPRTSSSASKRATPPPDAEQDPADNPVVDVSFDDAEKFAQWAKKRLPNAKEWEKAARGRAARSSPGVTIGAMTPPTSRSTKRQRAAKLAPVSSFAPIASPYGAFNMIGNVWEWVDTPAPLDEHEFELLKKYSRVYSPPLTRDESYYQVRGGSFLIFPAIQIRSGFRLAYVAGASTRARRWFPLRAGSVSYFSALAKSGQSAPRTLWRVKIAPCLDLVGSS